MQNHLRMRKFLFAALILSINICCYGQNTDSTNKETIINKFKKDLVGTWMPDDHEVAILEDGHIVDTAYQNNLPYRLKAKNKIVFYKNGYFRVDNTGTLKPYEIIGIKHYKPNYSITVKLDGYNYELSIVDDTLSLSYGSIQYRWTVSFNKKQ